MLRLLAFIARAHPLDDPSLNAHLLLGQAKRAELLQKAADHLLATGGTHQAQRNQAVIHQADRVGKTDRGRSQPLRLCRPQHQGAHQGMSQQQGVEFLDHR